MTQFSANLTQQNNLGTKKKQTQDRLANPANKTSLRDRRRLALINQGVDPDQLNSGIRTDRNQHARLMRESRRAFQSGDTATGERLRAQADELKYSINDRFKISRPTLRDLPPEEQMRRRAESRAQLQAQLPAIAAHAADRERQDTSDHTDRLSRIGRQVHKLEFGSDPSPSTSPQALAELARTASPDVIQRVTRGVGLPEAPQTGNADRLSRLAQTGVQFDDFAPSQRTDDPAVIDRVRTGQAQDRLDRHAGLAVRGNQRDAAVAASEAAVDDQRLRIDQNDAQRSQLRVDGGSADQLRDLEIQNQELDLDRKRAETELIQTQIKQATQQAERELERSGITLDTNLASSAAATITTRLGKALDHNDQRAISRAVESINSILTQYEGENLKEVASHFLRMFTEGGVDFGDIDFDSQSLFGGRGFVDSPAADRNEQMVTELVNKLRLYASGNIQPAATPIAAERLDRGTSPASRSYADRFGRR